MGPRLRYEICWRLLMVIDDVGELLDMMNVESGESERSSYDREQDGGGGQKITGMLGSCVNIHIGSI